MKVSRRMVPAAGVLALLACYESVFEPGGQRTVTPAIQGIAVAPDGYTIAVGDTVRMKASTIPRIDVEWKWMVVPSHRATIDEEGLLTAVLVGDVEVYACADVPDRLCGVAPIFIR